MPTEIAKAESRVPDVDEFGIEIQFAAHSDAPSRVFRAMTALIDAFQEIDSMLVGSIGSEIRPTTLLEDIEAGSLRVWLRNILESVDDTSLESGEWKKVIGSYLVRAKRIMIDWTKGKGTITSVGELDELRKALLDEAAKTHALSIPAYAPLPAVEVARCVEMIAEAVEPLANGDSVQYLSADRPVEVNRDFGIVPEDLTSLLVKETLEGESLMILIIKRPDFLGDARWEFRHGKQPFEARILDTPWVSRFRKGLIVLRPGDALRVLVSSAARYGYDGELIDSRHEIMRVLEVMEGPRSSQDQLFSDGQ